jgi:hypothetical protein
MRWRAAPRLFASNGVPCTPRENRHDDEPRVEARRPIDRRRRRGRRHPSCPFDGGTTRIVTTIEIARPPGVVFDYVTTPVRECWPRHGTAEPAIGRRGPAESAGGDHALEPTFVIRSDQSALRKLMRSGFSCAV